MRACARPVLAQVGSIEVSTAERKRLALASHAFNRKTPIFCELFPDLVVEPAAGSEAEAAAEAEAEAAAAAAQQHAGGSPLQWLVGIAVVAVAAYAYSFRE